MRSLISLLLGIICLTFCVSLIPVQVQAQLSSDDIAALQRQARTEGWNFEIRESEATSYSLDELCGLSEPPDWREKAPQIEITAKRDLPSQFDWRDEVGGLPPVRNQGGCGACWAFASVGVVECGIRITEGIDVNLAEQWLLSCNTQGYDCGGGWWVLSYFHNRIDACGEIGGVLESDNPYAASSTLPCNCPYDRHYTIDSWAYIAAGGGTPTVDQIKTAIVEYGPVATAITVNNAFQSYGGGVFDDCTTASVNHGVVIVGWDDSQLGGVWIIRNSWGGGWGEGGYMRIQYGCSRVGYAAALMTYRPLYVEATPTFGQAPLSVEFAGAAPGTEVDSFTWNFGDGATGSGETVSHQYDTPGYHDVSLNVFGSNSFGMTQPGCVSVYADTMSIDETIAERSSVCRVDISATNYLPLGKIVLPVSWAGDLDITYDSFTVAGTRTEYFDDIRMLNYDIFNERAAFQLQPNSAGDGTYLSSGSGPILSLYFTVGGYPISGENPISIAPYSSYVPLFMSYAGEYDPVVVSGSIATGCCQGSRGSIVLDNKSNS